MYEEKWGLEDKPFQNVPDTRYLFYSQSHEEALVRLLYCVTESKGLMLLLGRWGIGKTFLCRVFREKVRDKGYEVALIHPPPATVDDFLSQIAHAFFPEQGPMGRFETYRRLSERVEEMNAEGREPVIVIDEAQYIRNPEIFEEIRFLLDMSQGGRFLVNIILVGVPDLWNQVRRVEGLRHRIGIYYRIDPLTREETEEYIMHRLRIAGLSHNIFLPDALDAVCRESGGVPAVINSICDLAMLIAAGEETDDVEPGAVGLAVEEIQGKAVVEEETAG